MPDFLLLMHGDAAHEGSGEAWRRYLRGLRETGHFQGGSSIGGGECVRKTGGVRGIAAQLTGYIRISAADLAQARTLVAGNPVYEAGGTVEIRELPADE